MPKVSGFEQALLLDRYRVADRVGQGGMALVYRAHDERLQDREVVVKIPHPALLQDDEFAGRFAREIRSLIGLSHAHIVDILDAGEHDDTPFVVLKYLAGGSLRERIVAGVAHAAGLHRLQDLATWLPDVAKALDFIHGQGYVHRDVKPDNILFDAHGHVYLSDFGIAKALSAHEASGRQATVYTMTGLPLGTPRYMPPELILGKDCDGRSDQYALAVTVYEALSGQVPYDGASPTAIYELQKQPPHPLDAIVLAIPPAVNAAVQRGLSLKPTDRFPTCREFAENLLRPLGQSTPAPNAASSPVAKAASDADGAIPAKPAWMPSRPAAKETPRPVAQPTPGPPPQGTYIQTVRITCPNCHAALTVNSINIDKSARCPGCQAVFPTMAEQRESTRTSNRNAQSSEAETHAGSVQPTLVERSSSSPKSPDPSFNSTNSDRTRTQNKLPSRKARVVGGFAVVAVLGVIWIAVSNQSTSPSSSEETHLEPMHPEAKPNGTHAPPPSAATTAAQKPVNSSPDVTRSAAVPSDVAQDREPAAKSVVPSESIALPENKVNIVIRSVRLLRSNASSDVWDKSGAPDPKVSIEEVGGTRQSYATPAAQDTHDVTFGLSALRVPIGAQLRITVYDEDLFEDDFVGTTTATVNIRHIKDKELSLTFGRVESLVLALRSDRPLDVPRLPSTDDEKAAILRVLSEDKALGGQGRSSTEIANAMNKLDLRACPGRFQDAYRKHTAAWERNDLAAIERTFSDVLESAQMYGVDVSRHE